MQKYYVWPALSTRHHRHDYDDHMHAVQLCAKWGLDLSTACTCMYATQTRHHQADWPSGTYTKNLFVWDLWNIKEYIELCEYKYFQISLKKISWILVKTFPWQILGIMQITALSSFHFPCSRAPWVVVMVLVLCLLHQICFFHQCLKWTCNMIFVLHCSKLPLG